MHKAHSLCPYVLCKMLFFIIWSIMQSENVCNVNLHNFNPYTVRIHFFSSQISTLKKIIHLNFRSFWFLKLKLQLKCSIRIWLVYNLITTQHHFRIFNTWLYCIAGSHHLFGLWSVTSAIWMNIYNYIKARSFLTSSFLTKPRINSPKISINLEYTPH